MDIDIPNEVLNDKNKIVLTFLQPLSCHSDIVEPIHDLLKDEKEVKFFCTDPVNFKYCFWYFENTIFAFASGMHNIGLLIPSELILEAISVGAIESDGAGSNWLLFPYHHIELKKWVGVALSFSRKISS